MGFGKKDKKILDETAPTLIGINCTVEGNLKGSDSVCIEGKVLGQIESEQNVYINKDAVVEGDIIAQNVVIHGKVIGNVTAKEATVIGNHGKVIGDVTTNLFSVETGGVLHGRCSMETQIKNIDEDSRIKNLFEKFSIMSNKKSNHSYSGITQKNHNALENSLKKDLAEDDIIEIKESSEES